MHAHADVNTPADVTFDSSMSDEDFFKWLKSRRISDRDCKTLSGKINNNYHAHRVPMNCSHIFI